MDLNQRLEAIYESSQPKFAFQPFMPLQRPGTKSVEAYGSLQKAAGSQGLSYKILI